MLSFETLVVIWASGAVASSNNVLKTPRGDFLVVPLTWLNVPVWPGKAGVNLTGTLQQIEQQAIELNPDWETEIAPTWRSHENDLKVKDREAPEKRDHNLCESGYPVAFVRSAQSMISDLRRFPGTEVYLPSGVSCSPVGCDQEVEIHVCNITPDPRIANYDGVANAATVIVNDCKFSKWSSQVVSGWRFHNDGLNVLVRGPRGNDEGYCLI